MWYVRTFHYVIKKKKQDQWTSPLNYGEYQRPKFATWVWCLRQRRLNETCGLTRCEILCRRDAENNVCCWNILSQGKKYQSLPILPPKTPTTDWGVSPPRFLLGNPWVCWASFLRWGVTYGNVTVSSWKDTLHSLHWWDDGFPTVIQMEPHWPALSLSTPAPPRGHTQLGLSCTQRMDQSCWLFRPGSQLYFFLAPSPWLLCGFSCSQVTWMWEAPAQQAILCATGFLALGLLSSTLPVCLWPIIETNKSLPKLTDACSYSLPPIRTTLSNGNDGSRQVSRPSKTVPTGPRVQAVYSLTLSCDDIISWHRFQVSLMVRPQHFSC